MILVVSAIIFVPGPVVGAFGQPWKLMEVAGAALYITFDYIDLRQTKALVLDGRGEMNPRLGKHPTQEKIDQHFAVSVLGKLALAHALPAPWRSLFLYFSAGRANQSVIHNWRLGYRLGF